MSTSPLSATTIAKDLSSGLIVFLVALPLCLGIALASGAPLFSGILAGIIGGVLIGSLSGSHTSVSGPAAGLTAVVADQIADLGSFSAFLLAVVVAGVIQIVLGVIRAGSLSAFFPSSVIKGLLAAIGVILILKQIPHLLGHDRDPEGEMSFEQPDHESTLSEIGRLFSGEIHWGAMVIGISSLAILIFWDRYKPLKKSLSPAPLVVVVLGVLAVRTFSTWSSSWLIESSHLVQVPVAKSLGDFLGFLQYPDFSQWLNPQIYIAGTMLAVVASLETLLNLDAVDKLDRKQRLSPPSRELWAQGIGNVTCGLLGGIPVTSVVVRGSVNVMSGSETRLSTIVHGILLILCVAFLPGLLNTIPLSCLAAILLQTGFKLASPKLFRQMWHEGRYQFAPFLITLVAIVFTDLLIGIVFGLTISLLFILNSNLRRPVRAVARQHFGGEVLHLELANQVSFLNRPALERTLRSVPRGSHILLDGRNTDYLDPDILSLIREFRDLTGPALDVRLSLRGFRPKYELPDNVLFDEFATKAVHKQLTPCRVNEILRDGNERFCSGNRIERDLARRFELKDFAPQPMAVVFTGIDSRSPLELIFDAGLGDLFAVRVPGTVVCPEALGGMEYACAIGDAKLVVVMGHTKSRLVTTAIERIFAPQSFCEQLPGCDNLQSILQEIEKSVPDHFRQRLPQSSAEVRSKIVEQVTRLHVNRAVRQILTQSPTIRKLVHDGRVAVIGAIFDVSTGRVEFIHDEDRT